MTSKGSEESQPTTWEDKGHEEITSQAVCKGTFTIVTLVPATWPLFTSPGDGTPHGVCICIFATYGYERPSPSSAVYETVLSMHVLL